MALASIKEVLRRDDAQTFVVVEAIKTGYTPSTGGGQLVDLSDRFSQDRLKQAPAMTARKERSSGRFDVQVTQAVLDDSDGFWSKTPPAGIDSWRGIFLRFSLRTQFGQTTLVYAIIEDVTTDSATGNATVDLSSLGSLLVDKQADRVRNGYDWYVNRPLGWLVRELLLTALNREDVDAFTLRGKIKNSYQIPIAGGSRGLSHYGRPPEFDGTVWREDTGTIYGSPMCPINDSSSAYEGQVLVGIDDGVWLWNPEDDEWTKLGAFGSNRKVHHIFWNYNASFYIAVAWEPEFRNDDSVAHFSGHVGGNTLRFAWGLNFSSNFTEYAAPPANVWTGHHALRAGGYDAGNSFTRIGGVGSSDSGRFGVNMPGPAGQHLFWGKGTQGGGPPPPPYNTAARYATAWNVPTGGLTSMPRGQIDGTNKWGVEEPGYYGFDNGFFGTGDVRPGDYRFNFGQQAGAFAMMNAGDILIFFIVERDTTNKRYNYSIYKFDTYNETYTDTTVNMAVEGGQSYQPHHVQYEPDDSHFWVACSAWKEDAWVSGAPISNEVAGAIYKFQHSSPGTSSRIWWSQAYSTSLDPNKYVPIQLCFGTTDQWLAVAFINYTKVGQQGLSVVAILDTTLTITSQIDKSRSSARRQFGLARDADAGRIYWHDPDGNVLVSAEDDDNSVDASVEDSNFPPVEGDDGLNAGLVWSEVNRAIYGISGGGEGAQPGNEILASPRIAKNYLWQFKDSLTDRIELADFSDMNVWQVMEELAAVGDFVFGFDGIGDFFFLPRPTPSGTLPILNVRGAKLHDTLRMTNLRKSMGYREIFNVAEVVPSRAVLRAPEGTVRVLERPSDFARDSWEGDVEAYQANSRRMNVHLRCAFGGQVGSEDDGVVASDEAGNTVKDFSPGGSERLHRLRFSFLVYEQVIETQILNDRILTDSTVRIPIQHAEGITTSFDGFGDEIVINDTIVRQIVSKADIPSSGYTVLTLSSNLGESVSIGDRAVIRTFSTNRWSDGLNGVTQVKTAISGTGSQGDEIDIDVDSTAMLPVGTVLSISSAGGMEEMRVKEVLDADSVTVIRGVGGTPVVAHAVDDVVRAYWAPIQNATWPAETLFPIGGTGLSLKIRLPAIEKPFMVGDSIDVVCNGLEIERLELAKQIAQNKTSIQKYGRRPFPVARDSRFLGYRQALEVAKRMVADFAFPHFQMQADGPLVDIPVLVTGGTQTASFYLIEDPHLLPSDASTESPNGDDPPASPDTTTAVASDVRAFSIDPFKDRMTLELRGYNQHDR